MNLHSVVILTTIITITVTTIIITVTSAIAIATAVLHVICKSPAFILLLPVLCLARSAAALVPLEHGAVGSVAGLGLGGDGGGAGAREGDVAAEHRHD
jgi:hypothetical protein